jgi:hypothetical protein
MYVDEPDDTDTDTDTGGTVATATAPAAVDDGKPKFHKVKLSHPSQNGKVVFRSISEERAQKWLESHYPRGSEAHLEAPDGTTTHFEAERQGENGQSADKWAPFDLEEWQPVDQNVPPGDSLWADKEG